MSVGGRDRCPRARRVSVAKSRVNREELHDPGAAHPDQVVGLSWSLLVSPRACRGESQQHGLHVCTLHRSEWCPAYLATSVRTDASRFARLVAEHPALRFSKDRPSVVRHPGVHSRRRCRLLRPSAARHCARSALVVSHHLDGFLLQDARRLVASCCRPWGSPGLGLAPCPAPQSPAPRGVGLGPPLRCLTLQSQSHPCSRSHVTAALLPPRRLPACDTGSTSRPCSTRASGTSRRCCHPPVCP